MLLVEPRVESVEFVVGGNVSGGVFPGGIEGVQDTAKTHSSIKSGAPLGFKNTESGFVGTPVVVIPSTAENMDVELVVQLICAFSTYVGG